MSNEKLLQGPPAPDSKFNMSLGQFFFDFAEKYRDRICQIDATVDQSEIYSSVKQRSIRLAIALREQGVTSKDVILICSNNTLDNTIPIIASFYLGAKVSNLAPSLSIPQVQHLLNLITPTIIFVEESSVSLMEDSLKDTSLNPKLFVLGQSTNYITFADLVVPQPNEDTFKPVAVNSQDTAILFFSSGTTGPPKAVCHSHQNLLKSSEAVGNYGLNTLNTLHYITMFGIAGIFMLIHTFMEGGTRIFCRIVDGENTLRLIEKYKVSLIFMFPIRTYILTNVKNSGLYDTSSLRCLIISGSSLSRGQIKRLDDMFENANIILFYALTEAGLVSQFKPGTHQNLIKSKIGSSGKLIRGFTVKMVDPDTDQVLGPNEKGEIRVKSSGLMKGYYNVDSSPYFDSEGFFKTGDVGYYDEDECIYVIGRIKEMFKYKTYNIVPSSIEMIILEHPAVKECVVFGLPADGDGDIPTACVVLKENCDASKEEIGKFVEDRVHDNEKLRGGITIVESFPKTPSGKPIRGEVRRIIMESFSK